MEYIILWYFCFVYWIFINCSVVTFFFSSSFLDTLIDRIWCLNEKIYDRKLARYLAETKYHYSNEMVTGKREFAFLRTGAVKHSRLPPRSRQVIKALLNWFLFPVELFYLTKNRQNAGTNNEWGLLDRNSLFVQSPSLPFPISSCSSLILFLSLSRPPPFLSHRFFSSSLPVENVDDNDGARWKRKLFPRFASQTRRFNDETRPKEESRFSSGSFKPCVRF